MKRLLTGVAAILTLAAAVRLAPAAAPTDQQISDAIAKGKAFLFSQQATEGNWDTKVVWNTRHPLAPTSMACYALLECGVPTTDPQLFKGLEWLRTAETDSKYLLAGDSTYTMGFRAQAWLLANQRTQNAYGEAMKRDIATLVASTVTGGYDYICTGIAETKDHGRADNSNSQLALYGAWAAKLGNVDVPKSYWREVQDYWLDGQHPDGGWGYLPKDKVSRITLTAAGVASLQVCFDAQYQGTFANVDAAPPEITQAIEKGLAYLDGNFADSMKNPATYEVADWRFYYHLFGIERAAIAAGRVKFGETDWYYAGAEKLLAMQKADGSWTTDNGKGNEVVWTSYALMFLAAGERPVTFAQLLTTADSLNRPHAVSNVTSWMGATAKTRYRGLRVSFKDSVQDWSRSKALLVTGAKDPKFTADQKQRLREYVANGGAIFSVTEGQGKGFQGSMTQLYKELFPYCVVKAAGDDPATASLAGKTVLSVVTDGDWVLALHTDEDLTRDWQANVTSAEAFDVAKRIYAFIDGQAKDKKAPSVLLTLTPEQFKAWGVSDEPLVQLRTALAAAMAAPVTAAPAKVTPKVEPAVSALDRWKNAGKTAENPVAGAKKTPETPEDVIAAAIKDTKVALLGEFRDCLKDRGETLPAAERSKLTVTIGRLETEVGAK